MIGLVNMIRAAVRVEHPLQCDDWEPVTRKQLYLRKDIWSFPISRYYYRLLDACPLRIPHDKQHSEGRK